MVQLNEQDFFGFLAQLVFIDSTKNNLKTYASLTGFRFPLFRRKAKTKFADEVLAFRFFMISLAPAYIKNLELNYNDVQTFLLESVAAQLASDIFEQGQIKVWLTERSKYYLDALDKSDQWQGPGTPQGAMILAEKLLATVHSSNNFPHKKFELHVFIKTVFNGLVMHVANYITSEA